MQEWDDVTKAQWILENGPVPEIVWIFERVGDQVFKRPAANSQLPPWINTQRQQVLQYTAPGYNLEYFALNRQ